MRRAIPSTVAAGVIVALALLCLRACDSSADAPTNLGVCWRLGAGRDGPQTFSPVSTGVRNLETCAAHLEAVALREGKSDLTGAYQGQFIFITPDMIQSSMRLAGARYRLFDAATRAKIDRQLKWMLDDARRPSLFAPNAEEEAHGVKYRPHRSPRTGGVTQAPAGPISSPP